ncbi:hypothetical protein BC629DRAFT_1446399 [Irpex lacteus]|nr:hypothetical protein BC629DRAFT_1446399 [Irpex lacteus]
MAINKIAGANHDIIFDIFLLQTEQQVFCVDDSDDIPHHLPEPLKIVSRGSIAIRSVVVDGGLRPGQVLGLKYSASIKAIMSLSRLKGPWIIPTARLRYHIKNYCAGQFNLGRTCTTEAEWNIIAQHILHGHCIPTTQTSDTLATTLPHQLANSIPSTASPLIMFGCPKPSCSYRAAAAPGQPKEDTNITHSCQEKHSTCGEDLIKIKFKPTPVQKGFLLGSDSNSTETGWNANVSNLRSDREIAGILRLIETLSPTHLNLTSRAEYIKKGLFYVYEFAVDYLKNCNNYLNHKDALVRQAIFAGSINKKSKHRNVQLWTLKQYSSEDCDSTTADLFIHDIFDTLLRSSSLGNTLLACPTNQILLLMLLLDHGNYYFEPK